MWLDDWIIAGLVGLLLLLGCLKLVIAVWQSHSSVLVQSRMAEASLLSFSNFLHIIITVHFPLLSSPAALLISCSKTDASEKGHRSRIHFGLKCRDLHFSTKCTVDWLHHLFMCHAPECPRGSAERGKKTHTHTHKHFLYIYISVVRAIGKEHRESCSRQPSSLLTPTPVNGERDRDDQRASDGGSGSKE